MKIILQVMSCDQILYLKLINYLLDELGTSNGGGHSTQNTRTYIQVRTLKKIHPLTDKNKNLFAFTYIHFLTPKFLTPLKVSKSLPRNERKQFDLRYHTVVKSNFFVRFLGELRRP